MNIVGRITRLLDERERKEGVKVAVALLCTTLLDFVSLASLLPVLYWLLKGGQNNKAALLFSLLAVSLIVIKGTAGISFARFQNRYMLSIYRRLSLALYRAYFNKGLLFIKEEGTSRLSHDINFVSFAFSQRVLPALLKMASDTLLICMVATALAIYDFSTSMILLISFIPFMLIYIFGVRKRIKALGKEELDVKRRQGRVVADTFKGFAELQVSGAFPSVESSFRSGLEKISANRLQIDTLMRLPLFLGEMAVVLGLILLVVTRSGDVSLLIGIFAVASFRLLPALRSIMTGYAQIENVIYCLDIMEKGLQEEPQSTEHSGLCPPAAPAEKIFTSTIEFSNLTYSFPDSDVIINNFNCTINRGEFVGFNGHSGVGKTTLFNLLLGFITPQSGSIKADGRVLEQSMRRKWLAQIGYVPQDVFIFNGTLAENIALGEERVDRERVEEIIGMVSLKEWRDTLADGIDTVMSEEGKKLSGGQRQRIGIARALYRKVDLLLLDEATSALDNATELEINRMLVKLREQCKGLTILTIAHRESSLLMCDRVVTIE